MINLTATTTKFAAARGLGLDVYQLNGVTLLDVFEADDDCEPMFMLQVNDNGSFSFHGNVYLNSSIKEELAAFYADEKALRGMLKFVAQELAATKH